MSAYEVLRARLSRESHRWLITGVAGFIGSHLLETLLELNQDVVGLDDFSSGSRDNLEEVRQRVGDKNWQRFQLREGSVVCQATCADVCDKVDFVLHQAGFVSVPRSLENPLACHETNVTGTLNILMAARDHAVRRVVYASSSAVYGDDPRLPKLEAEIGRPLSPYGASKRIGEIYAQLFTDQFGVETVGLRYFNVFGSRQDPQGGYAAVIPQWIAKLIRGEQCFIHGEGGISRDFCPVSDVVQANLLAAVNALPPDSPRVFNVALGGSTTLAELFRLLSTAARKLGLPEPLPVQFGPSRRGDIPHSAADIAAFQSAVGFKPSAPIAEAIESTMRWYAA